MTFFSVMNESEAVSSTGRPETLLPSSAAPVDGPEQVARDVDRVGAIVDEHAAAGDFGVGVPAAAHVNLGAEPVLEELDVTQHSRGDHGLGADDVLDVAELGRHHQPAVRAGPEPSPRHRRGSPRTASRRECACPLRSGGTRWAAFRRRAHNGGVDLRSAANASRSVKARAPLASAAASAASRRVSSPPPTPRRQSP